MVCRIPILRCVLLGWLVAESGLAKEDAALDKKDCVGGRTQQRSRPRHRRQQSNTRHRSLNDEAADNDRHLFGIRPTKITVVDRLPATKLLGSISNASGTPWCGGNRTFWLVGHEPEDSPYCEYEPDLWHKPYLAKMDLQDVLNQKDDPKKERIDRHDCVAIDANKDGKPDIICGVGANKGHGWGYVELYLTQEDGSIKKWLGNHGLYKYPRMRHRHVKLLRGHNGAEMVFFGTEGASPALWRNYHRMFRNSYDSIGYPYFEEVRGPWLVNFDAACVLSADFDGDGQDDLVVCNEEGMALVIRQQTAENWLKLLPPRKFYRYLLFWQAARVEDVTGDGIADLVVTTFARGKLPSYLRIFKGRQTYAPRMFPFDMTRPYYQRRLLYHSPDIEILDVNGDGRKDIYVVQVDRTQNSQNYCRIQGRTKDWWGGQTQPPEDWVPPRDMAADLILLGRGDSVQRTWQALRLNHRIPGCGGIAQRFGDYQTLIVAHGDMGHPGYSALFQW